MRHEPQMKHAKPARAHGCAYSEGLSTALHNLIEPDGLLRHFEEHLPTGFSRVHLATGGPAFAASFDLLTTLDDKLRRRLRCIPFLGTSRLLRPQTLFAGSTVSEYTLLPQSATADAFVDDLMAAGARYPFVIVKDLPDDALLVGDDAFAFSKGVAEACDRRGFFLVAGQALAYVPIDFAGIDDFLSPMSHARRKSVRRKLRSRGRLSIDVVPIGADLFGDATVLADVYALYRNVYAQSELHFDQLTSDFFASVLRDASIDGHVVMYRSGTILIGFNLCVFGPGMYIDKYIGFRYPEAHAHDLYTVSWFFNLEQALRRGCRFYVAGWTDPEIKRQLGARFTWTRHAVFIRNPLVRRAGRILKPLFESDERWKRNAFDHP